MEQNKSTSRGSFLFVIVSVIAGILAGFLGYLLGQYFYMLFVFPFILLSIGLIFFIPAVLFFKNVSLRWIMLCGLLMGLLTLTTFHYTEYMLFRSKAIQSAQTAQKLDAAAASKSVDDFLRSKVGLGGFFGFIKYQPTQLKPYIFYTTKDNQLTNTFVFYLHGRNGWLYLAGEVFVLLGGAMLFGFLAGKRRRQGV